MKVVIDLHGEAAERYMKDKLSETMRRLIADNEWACEREAATGLKRALEQSHIVSKKDDGVDDVETLKAIEGFEGFEGLLRSMRSYKRI